MDLDAEIRSLYAGDPGDFVKGRDALAKQLRADKRADDAKAVKALRKPSKLAAILDRAVAEHPDAATAFAAAAAAAGKAQEHGGDLRAATTALRAAVRDLAAATPDPGGATAALVAIVADPDALEALLDCRLVDVPETGGFGPLPLAVADAPAKRSDDDAEARRREKERQAELARRRKEAEAALRTAEQARDAAAEKLAAAESAVADARAALDAVDDPVD